MHPKRKRRLITLLFVMIGLSIATGFVLSALRENINLYVTPSDITAQHLKLKAIRVGGMVKKASVQHDNKTLRIRFKVTDFHHDLNVQYDGVLPVLFKEGQGVVIDGYLTDKGHLTATRVLAKHDEKYMPPKIEQHV